MEELAAYCGAEAMPLMFGCNAEGVQFNIPPTIDRRQKTNIHSGVSNDLCVIDLKLFEKVNALHGLIPVSAGRRDMRAHGSQEHIEKEGYVVVGGLVSRKGH
jgi:hypothetical protein